MNFVSFADEMAKISRASVEKESVIGTIGPAIGQAAPYFKALGSTVASKAGKAWTSAGQAFGRKFPKATAGIQEWTRQATLNPAAGATSAVAPLMDMGKEVGISSLTNKLPAVKAMFKRSSRLEKSGSPLYAVAPGLIGGLGGSYQSVGNTIGRIRAATRSRRDE